MFFCSIYHLTAPFRKHMIFTWTSSEGQWFLICDWWISVCLFCFCVSRFVACDHPISGYNQLVWFKDCFFWPFLFLSLARIKQCLPPSIGKNSTHHRDFLRLALSFVFVGLIVGAEKPKIPLKFSKCAVQYSKFGGKTIYI